MNENRNKRLNAKLKNSLYVIQNKNANRHIGESFSTLTDRIYDKIGTLKRDITEQEEKIDDFKKEITKNNFPSYYTSPHMLDYFAQIDPANCVVCEVELKIVKIFDAETLEELDAQGI